VAHSYSGKVIKRLCQTLDRIFNDGKPSWGLFYPKRSARANIAVNITETVIKFLQGTAGTQTLLGTLAIRRLVANLL